MLIDFKDEEFETKIRDGDVSVVLFSAEWCAMCRFLRPIMEGFSDSHKDRASFHHADIEAAGIGTGSDSVLVGVPTVIIYKKGHEVDRKVGGVAEGEMRQFLDRNI